MKNLLLVSSLLLFLFACEKEEIQTTSSSEVNNENVSFNFAPNCTLNDSKVKNNLFYFCSGEYQINGELRLINDHENGQKHQIIAYMNCHKQGSPQDLIPISEFQLAIFGNSTVACEMPISISIPSDYNTNLINGQVLNHKICNDCPELENIITYNKEVGLNPNYNDIIIAHFFAKIEDCGEVHTEEFSVRLQ